MNPLLDFSGLPRFAEIKPEEINPYLLHLPHCRLLSTFWLENRSGSINAP